MLFWIETVFDLIGSEVLSHAGVIGDSFVEVSILFIPSSMSIVLDDRICFFPIQSFANQGELKTTPP
jgi:hypothetical protein